MLEMWMRLQGEHICSATSEVVRVLKGHSCAITILNIIQERWIWRRWT